MNFLKIKLTNRELILLDVFISQFYIHPFLRSWQIVGWQKEVAKISLTSIRSQMQSVCGLQRPVLKAGGPPQASSLLFLDFRRQRECPRWGNQPWKRRGQAEFSKNRFIKYEIGFLGPCVVGILNLRLELRVCHLLHEMLVSSRGALCGKWNRGETEMQVFLKMCCSKEKWFCCLDLQGIAFSI